MFAFQVKDMTCGHCVGMVTRVVQGVDETARLSVDLARQRVEIESARARAEDFSAALQAAGYTPVPVPGA